MSVSHFCSRCKRRDLLTWGINHSKNNIMSRVYQHSHRLFYFLRFLFHYCNTGKLLAHFLRSLIRTNHNSSTKMNQAAAERAITCKFMYISHNLINMHFYLLSHPLTWLRLDVKYKTILHENQIIAQAPTLHRMYSHLAFFVLVWCYSEWCWCWVLSTMTGYVCYKRTNCVLNLNIKFTLDKAGMCKN